MKLLDKIKAKREKSKKLVVTQQNLEESREAILAKGKKFRYPFQYAKHRLIINTIIIGVIALVVFAVIGWAQLYKFQNTGDVMYRFTKVLNLSVAKVDNANVRFSDYLMLYRSSITSIEQQQEKLDNSKEAEQQKMHYRRQALDEAEEYSYALSKMSELNVTVSDAEIDAVVDEHRSIDGEQRTEEAFAGIISKNFGLSMTEYRRLLMLSLAKKKIAQAMDQTATQLSDEIATKLAANGNDFARIADEYKDNDLISYETTSDAVSINNLDGGRAAMAASLAKVGDVSAKFVSKNGDGYYIVKQTAHDGDKVGYESIWIRFSEFDKAFQKLQDDGKIKEYIKLDATDDVSLKSSVKVVD